MIDWTRPIEAVHEDGRVARVAIKSVSCPNPDARGDYYTTPTPDTITDTGIWNPTGETWESNSPGWRIRNVSSVSEETDELTQLRAFRDAAIAKYPDLAPVDADVLQARKIALKFALPAQISGMTSHRTNQGEFDDSDVMAAIGEAMDWARANPC